MTTSLNIYFVIVCIYWPSINAVALPVVVEHPSSLQLQVHEVGIFSCAADECKGPGCFGQWRVNGSYTHNFSGKPMEEFTSKGLIFLEQQTDGDRLTLTIVVHASKPIGNTTLSCQFTTNVTVNSETAILSVISRQATTDTVSDPPTRPTASVNPSIVMNLTHVSLAWFPHSLWPGHIINYYNVSFANKTDGSTTYSQIHGDHGNETVYYAKQIPDDLWTCTEFTFAVSAVNSSGFTLQKFNISSYIAATKILFPSATIKSTVLYQSDGTLAHVSAYVDLPKSICNFQELNYTLILEEESGHLVTTLGPFQKFGPGVVKETIVSKLKRNKVYSLKARVNLHTESATSYKHYFNTSLQNWDASTPFIVNEINSQDANVYKAATGISISIAVVMLLALIFVIISVYIWHKQRGIDNKCEESKQRVCQTMVPNPIYDGDGMVDEDGPVYDSVRPQYETLVAVQAPLHPRVTPADEEMHHQASSVTEMSHNKDIDVVRYVDPPIQLPPFRSQSFAQTIADPDGGSMSTFYSVSIPPSRLMAVKKNCEEHNKLQLTLDLGESENDYSEALPKPGASSRGTATEPLDESYMVMNSASALSNLQSVGHVSQNI